MKIQIKRLNNQPFFIECDWHSQIWQIKQAIEKLHDLEIQRQVLIFKGKKVDDSEKLNQLKIETADFFVLVLFSVK